MLSPPPLAYLVKSTVFTDVTLQVDNKFDLQVLTCSSCDEYGNNL